MLKIISCKKIANQISVFLFSHKESETKTQYHQKLSIWGQGGEVKRDMVKLLSLTPDHDTEI